MLFTEQNSAILEKRLQDRYYVRNLRELVTESLLNFPKCSRHCLEELSTWPMVRASFCATPRPKFGLWTTFEHHDCGWLKCHVHTSHQLPSVEPCTYHMDGVNLSVVFKVAWAWILYVLDGNIVSGLSRVRVGNALEWYFSSCNNDIEDRYRKAEL